jgi:hypothetical protein
VSDEPPVLDLNKAVKMRMGPSMFADGPGLPPFAIWRVNGITWLPDGSARVDLAFVQRREERAVAGPVEGWTDA